MRKIKRRYHMNNDDRKRFKESINFLEIARKSDHLTSQAIIHSVILDEKFVSLLKRIYGWKEEDGKEIEEKIKQLEKENENIKTIKGKYENIKKFIKYGSIAAVIAGGVVGGIGLIIKNSKKPE
jgi:hypothetical protein